MALAPNQMQVQLEIDPIAKDSPPDTWVYLEAGAARTIAQRSVADGTLRIVVFRPEYSGTGLYLLQAEFLPLGVDAVNTKPGTCPCICSDTVGLIAHAENCPSAKLRLPSLTEVRGAMRSLLPDGMVMQLVLYPYYVKQLPNVLQVVQVGVLDGQQSGPKLHR